LTTGFTPALAAQLLRLGFSFRFGLGGSLPGLLFRRLGFCLCFFPLFLSASASALALAAAALLRILFGFSLCLRLGFHGAASERAVPGQLSFSGAAVTVSGVAVPRWAVPFSGLLPHL
jgi:hypothetical protein